MSARARLLLIVVGLSAAGPARADDDDEPVDFRRQILPIFEGACVECHGAKKASGALRLTGGVEALAGGITGKLVVPGKPGESYLLRRLRGEGDEDRMPLQRPPLSKKEIAVVARWIEEGAKVPPAPPTTFVPAPGGVRRLTVAQYRSSVRDLLGEVPVPVALEPDTLISGSAAVGAGRIVISRQATEKYALAASRLAARATTDPAWWSRWVPCEASAGSPTCAAGFVSHFGERAFRRPLTAAESERYLALARRTPGAFVAGVRAVVASLLQSPSFLYRVELGVPDPTDPSRRVLTDDEMASRLSFFLWGAPPDQELLDAAAAGRLSTDEGLRAQAERMLASPRSRATVETFFSELLRLGKLEHLPQFRSKYQQVSSTLGPAMREETLRVVEEIALDPERDFREIFDAPFTYVNGELAHLYGVAPPADESAFVRIELPAGGPRAGVLGQGSFLAVNAHPTAPSPTKRGRFIRETLLCQPVPPPPPDVSTKLPKDGKGPARTTRQKMAVHRTAVQCAGCHKAMDPLGLPFETYDGIGAFRERDNGLPIDASGELDGVPFRAPRELGALLRRSPKVGVCLARNLLRFALGHLEGEGEEPLVDELSQALERDGYHFRSLVLNVIASRGFRYVGEAAP